MKTIAVASDHAGFPLKEELRKYIEELGFMAKDYGAYSKESCDYPDYAVKVCEAVLQKKEDGGLLICGTGVGQNMVANKFPGIRAALCFNPFMAEMSRSHNDSNILVLGGRVIDIETAKKIMKVWLETPFSNEARHVQRLKKLEEIEKKICQGRRL